PRRLSRRRHISPERNRTGRKPRPADVKLSTGQIIICHRQPARSTKEIKIGVKQTKLEINFETDEDPKELAARIEENCQSDGLLTLSDTKGRQIFVPAGSLGYIEVGAETPRRVGFSA